MFGEDTHTQKNEERWVSLGASGFYQGLSADMQSYFNNSADIQRTCPVAGAGAWGHGVEVGGTEACKIQWFVKSE